VTGVARARPVATPAASIVEEVAGEWLVDLLGLPVETSLGFTTGATMANFTALAAARHAVLRAAGWDVGEDGLSARGRCTSWSGSASTPRWMSPCGSSASAGGTTWDGRLAMRISVPSWATTPEDGDRAVDAIPAVLARLDGCGTGG
jgi:hypothetical protein